jgi:hypothetical protein
MPGYAVTYSVVDNATKNIDAINRRIMQMRAPMERMSRSVSKFVDASGLRKVADGFGWIARAAGTVLQSLSGMVPVLGVITSGATIAGLAKLVTHFTELGVVLAANADRIGTSAQTLQQYQDAFRLAGGRAEDMTNALAELKRTSVAAFEGDTGLQYAFKQLGIDIYDANQHLKAAPALLQEVIGKLNDPAVLKDPADRQRLSGQILGDAALNVSGTIKRDDRPFQERLKEAAKYKALTDDQIRDMTRLEQAQAKLAVSLEHLGQQVAASLGKTLTPLLNDLANWLEARSPKIIETVDEMAKRFDEWAKNVKWEDVESALKRIETVALSIAAIFATKWALDMVKDIALVTLALGRVPAGMAIGAGGIGLLGSLGTIAAIAALIATPGDSKAPPETPAQRQAAADAAAEINRRQGYTGNLIDDLKRWAAPFLDPFGVKGWANSGAPTGYGPRNAPEPAVPYQPGQILQDMGITQPQYAAIAQGIADKEGARYDQMGGAGGQYAGRYQFGRAEITETARRLFEAVPTTQQFLGDPAMQERYMEAYTDAHHQHLMATSAKYRAMAPWERAEWLGYAHNQGAGGVGSGGVVGAGAAIETGQVGRDAFNTPGSAYRDAVRRRWAETMTGVAPPRQGPALPVPGFAPLAPVPGAPTVRPAPLTVPAGPRAPAAAATIPTVAPPVLVVPPGGPAAPIAPAAVPPHAAREPDPPGTGYKLLTREDMMAPRAPPIAAGPAMAPPDTVTGAISGAVDVSITHRNPPPDSTVTAKGSGMVNLAPPRTERASLTI